MLLPRFHSLSKIYKIVNNMDEFAEIGLGSVVVGAVGSFLGLALIGTALVPVGVGLIVFGAYRSMKASK